LHPELAEGSKGRALSLLHPELAEGSKGHVLRVDARPASSNRPPSPPRFQPASRKRWPASLPLLPRKPDDPRLGRSARY
jgi:hypothetical protein